MNAAFHIVAVLAATSGGILFVLLAHYGIKRGLRILRVKRQRRASRYFDEVKTHANYHTGMRGIWTDVYKPEDKK